MASISPEVRGAGIESFMPALLVDYYDAWDYGRCKNGKNIIFI